MILYSHNPSSVKQIASAGHYFIHNLSLDFKKSYKVNLYF